MKTATADISRPVVLDASAALLCVLDSPGSPQALEILETLEDRAVSAPELWLAEVGNGLWKRTRRDPPLDPLLAADMLDALRTMPIRLLPHTSLIARAFDIAVVAGSTVYDALYLAAAEASGALVLTADRGLALAAEAIGIDVILVGEETTRARST